MAMLPSSRLLFSAFLSLIIVPFSEMGCASSGAPATFLMNGQALLATRARVQKDDPAVEEGIKELRRRADRHLEGELWTVTSKPFAGPSGDKHDYVSIAPYFWPDPASPNGLPYILRDGQYNPETPQYDRARLNGMSEALHSLALAWYLTGEDRYAARAAEQLRTWFLDAETRMNPHLRYTQFVKGRDEGNPWGIIETEQLTRVVDAVMLLQGSKHWSTENHEQLQQWFTKYLDWLQTSELGKKEGAGPNNHGTFYDMQTADFALFIGRVDLARGILENAKTQRIAKHIEPDGRQPRELARTLSWHYSLLNLWGMFQLARLGEHVGVDLWNYESPDGRSIRKALDWLLPHAFGKEWEYEQITAFDYGNLVQVLRQAARIYQEPAYEEAIGRLPGMEREIVWVNLLNPAVERQE